MAKNEEKLFDMFPPVTTEEWLAKINVDLKGADFNKKLVWRTNEGFNVQPLYRKEDLEGISFLGTLPGQFPYVRGTREDNNWLIRQQVQGDDAAEMNRHALHILERGVDSLGICLCSLEPAELKNVLEGVDLKKVEVNVPARLWS